MPLNRLSISRIINQIQVPLVPASSQGFLRRSGVLPLSSPLSQFSSPSSTSIRYLSLSQARPLQTSCLRLRQDVSSNEDHDRNLHATKGESQTSTPTSHHEPLTPPPSPQASSTSAKEQDPQVLSEEEKLRRLQERVTATPHYQITFTCRPCSHRSAHFVSKHGYHQGSVLIQCPQCRARHVISDHLGMFGDRSDVTVEKLLQEKGEAVRKAQISEDGDIEFV